MKLIRRSIAVLAGIAFSSLTLGHFFTVRPLTDTLLESAYLCVDEAGTEVSSRATERETIETCGALAAERGDTYYVEAVERRRTHEIRGSMSIEVTPADAQITVVPPVVISSLSGGELGVMTDDYIDDQPVAANKIWSDTSDSWSVSALPVTNLAMIHTADADKATTGATTRVSFSLGSNYDQVIVWHDDSETTKPAWLTSTYVDCGIDIIDATGTYSGWAATLTGTVNLGGNCASGGCGASPNMYLVSVAPGWAPACQIPGASNPGTVQFSSSGYSADEDAGTLDVTITRAAGTDGPGGVDVVDLGTGSASAGTDYSTISCSESWSDGDASSETCTITLIDRAGDNGTRTIDLDLQNASGVTEGSPNAATVSILDADSPPSAADFYGDASSGDDANDCTSGTPCQTIGRLNQMPAGSTIELAGGTYRNNPINPQAANLTYRPALDEVAWIKGPTSGRMDYGVVCTAAGQGLTIERNGTGYIGYDGELVWGTGPGEWSKPTTAAEWDAITGAGSIKFGMFLNCTGADINIVGRRTNGWLGVTLRPETLDNLVLTLDHDFHGMPASDDVPTRNDHGDLILPTSSLPSSRAIYLNGCRLPAGAPLLHPGHSSADFQDGNWLICGQVMNSRWGDVSTWDAIDGNRNFSIRREVDGLVMIDSVINGGGFSPDNSAISCGKLQGTRAALAVGLTRNCYDWAHTGAAASWSHHARGALIAHWLFHGSGDVILYLEQWDSGSSNLDGYSLRNVVAWDYDLDGGGDDLVRVLCQSGCSGLDWRDMFDWHGGLVETSTGSCDDAYLTFSTSFSGNGRQSLSWYLLNESANFSNITCVADLSATYGNAPAYTTATTFTGYWMTDYAPTDDTLTANQGSNLALATNSGSGSTNLCVDDIRGFPDPVFGTQTRAAPLYGQLASFSTSDWILNLEGDGNIAYTDLAFSGSYPTIAGCFTLDSAASWSIGDAVNFPISSGSSPNIGPVL